MLYKRVVGIGAREQPVGWAIDLPIGSQEVEQLIGQHDVAIFAPFALPHVDDHTGAIDVLHGERDQLNAAMLRRLMSSIMRCRSGEVCSGMECSCRRDARTCNPDRSPVDRAATSPPFTVAQGSRNPGDASRMALLSDSPLTQILNADARLCSIT